MEAIKNKDIDSVRSIIASGIDLNHRSPGTVTYLDQTWCGYSDYDFELVKLLIENGADLNDPAYPAIVCASRRGRVEEIEYVLKRGANINAITHVGTSALWQASYYGYLDVIKFLLQAGLDINQHGGHALQIASTSGNLQVVQLLIAEKANINYQVFDRNKGDLSATPLHKAALFGHLEIMRYLLGNGANPLLKDIYGSRPYVLAKKRKDKNAMKLIASYEPKELHDLEKRAEELKKGGLPTAILKDLGEERKRVELSGSKYLNYIEYCAIEDVTEMDSNGVAMLNLLFDTDAYDALGFLVWIPSRKALASYDVEHEKLVILSDTTWKSFRKSPGVFIDRILDGEYESD